ncbi:MAG: hypothetical protein LUQ71_03325 [Methanoregula sp.]|jgi:hypothetical protein|nr:hypothetical protein [Methanoregula sp.]
MPSTSIAMLDKDHHIHMIPAERVLMLSIEHSAVKKVENERFEVECFLKLSVEGFPHPLEDVIRFTFAATRIPDQQMMTELTFVQNHIVKSVFDKNLAGDMTVCAPDDPQAKESGITISSEIKAQMTVSNQIREVLARNGALADSLVFVR